MTQICAARSPALEQSAYGMANQLGMALYHEAHPSLSTGFYREQVRLCQNEQANWPFKVCWKVYCGKLRVCVYDEHH